MIRLFVLDCTISVHAEQPFFLGLGTLSAANSSSRALGVSPDGSTVVGYHDTTHAQGGSYSDAFRWTKNGGMVLLGLTNGLTTTGYRYASASAVSADGGVIVGDRSPWTAGNQEVFRWTSAQGAVSVPPLPGPGYSASTASSADGSTVVGYGNGDQGGDTSDGRQAFRWTSAVGTIGLGDLPGGLFNSVANGTSADGSIVVGYSYSINGKEGFRWTNSGGMVGLGGLFHGTSNANGVSADGFVIVGSSRSRTASAGAPEGDGNEAFLWTTQTGMVGLGDLPGGYYVSGATAASADGSVIVGFGSTDTGQEAFIWDAAHGMRNIRQLLSTELSLALGGWSLTQAKGISDDGRTIVGYGTNPLGVNEGWIAYLGRAPVPEPSTCALAAVGLAALCSTRRYPRHLR